MFLHESFPIIGDLESLAHDKNQQIICVMLVLVFIVVESLELGKRPLFKTILFLSHDIISSHEFVLQTSIRETILFFLHE